MMSVRPGWHITKSGGLEGSIVTSDQVIMWAVGIIVTAGGLAIGHLYKLQGEMQQRMESAMANQLKDIWNVIHTLSQEINVDRKSSSESRVAMATTIGTLVTRQDLREEMGRVVSELDRRMTRHLG